MRSRRSLLAVLAGAFVLFVWHGLAQLFPWGTAVVDNFSATDGPSYVASTTELREAPPGTWTTPAFDEGFGGGISTLATDRTFSWVISVPSQAYSLPRYFAGHALTQVVVAVLLLLGHQVLRPLSRRRRGLVIAVVGATSALGVYGGMQNWMGMPAAYGLGQGFNHVVGWFLAFAVIDRIAWSGGSTVIGGSGAALNEVGTHRAGSAAARP